jgi:hypothetical protein
MTATICRPPRDLRTTAERQEAALVAAFRRMGQRERMKLLRAARRARLPENPKYAQMA